MLSTIIADVAPDPEPTSIGPIILVIVIVAVVIVGIALFMRNRRR